MKRLSMRFTTEGGGIATISVRDARGNLTAQEVNDLMDIIVANDVFNVKNGPINGKKDATLYDTTETDFAIV